MKKLLFIFSISISWGIGIQGLDLPNTAQSMALFNTGIASPLNSSINSSYYSNNKNTASFSLNYWFEGVTGKTISNEFGKHEISLNTFGIDDLDLWGEIPDSESLGTFGLQFSCISYKYLLNQGLKQNLGVKIKGLYSKLYTEYIYGLLFDIGLTHNFNKSFSTGLSLKNIGYINSDLTIPNLPSEYGIGLSYNLTPLKLTILTDYIYNDIKKEIFKFGGIVDLNFLSIYSSITNCKTNKYISTGFKMRYKNISCSYGILFQDIKTLGIPQSFQVTLYY